jgi:hypothetical protein
VLTAILTEGPEFRCGAQALGVAEEAGEACLRSFTVGVNVCDAELDIVHVKGIDNIWMSAEMKLDGDLGGRRRLKY